MIEGKALRAALFLWLFWLPLAGQDGGLGYQHIEREGPLSIHVLRADPEEVEIELVRALNNGVGRETVSSIARRSGAKAAVNAGFFTIGTRYDGLPAGILKIGGDWFGIPSKPRGAIGWTGRGEVAIGRLLMRWTLRLGDSSLPIDAVNRPRGDGDLVLYTWAFHRTTLTNPGGREFALRGGRLAKSGRGYDSPIPPGGYVLSAGGQADIAGLEPGRAAEVEYEFLPKGGEQPEARAERWRRMRYIANGAGVLIKGGVVVEDFSPEQTLESFISKKHPRTAVGVDGRGHWVVAVVDGRQPRLSVGLTLPEMARLMRSLECVDALNLDGGGSTTLVFEGEVKNSPSNFGRQRPVSDAIVFR